MAKRTCTFCGGGNLTKEHVLPRWLSKVVSFDNSTGELRGDAEYNEVARRSIPISPGERQVRNVCAGCNQGWMSDLETATEPVLTPLILGEERTLTAEEVDVLALWAAKTAVTTQFVMRDSGEIPRRQAAQIFERQRPAAEMQVFIAQMAEPWGRLYSRPRSLRCPPSDHPGFSLSCREATGRLVCHDDHSRAGSHPGHWDLRPDAV